MHPLPPPCPHWDPTVHFWHAIPFSSSLSHTHSFYYPNDAALFAPTNNAFFFLADSAFEYLMANTKVLMDVLLYHVVPKKIFLRNISILAPRKSVATLLPNKSLLVHWCIIWYDLIPSCEVGVNEAFAAEDCHKLESRWALDLEIIY